MINETLPNPNTKATDLLDTSDGSRTQRIVVLGATGYVGARLVPRLINAGHPLVAMARSASDVARWQWSADVETSDVDLMDDENATPLFQPNDVVVHLVHSMNGTTEFEQMDEQIAHRVVAEANRAGVARIVYLSGLGSAEDLSDHLESRHEVGEILADAEADVIELRAALLLGSGSASFEMLRSIGELGRVLLVPRQVVDTQVQPIAIDDALDDLDWAITSDDARAGIYDIGGCDTMSYAELIATYRRVALDDDFRPLPIPLVPTLVAQLAMNAILSLPRALVFSLVGSVEHDVVVRPGHDIKNVRPNRLVMTAAEAIEAAMAADDDAVDVSHWSDDEVASLPAAATDLDPDWAGPAEYSDVRTMETDVPRELLFASITGIGGRRGWLVASSLWKVRGHLDKIFFGGVGHRRGRRHPTRLREGDILDWWRVETIEPPVRLRLRAEMRMPGDGWLEWTLTDAPSSGETLSTTVTQTASYRPRGLLGRCYWWALLPFHGYIFPRLLDRLVEQATDEVTP